MAMSYKTDAAVKYREEFAAYVAEECQKQNWSFTGSPYQHFYADAVFYFDRMGKDPNNYFKVMLDAITDTGKVWEDDKLVCERVQGMYYDSDHPRVELSIYPTEYIGVFHTHEVMDRFTERCGNCSRWRDGRCSILLKAQKGKIQDEVQDGICAKYHEKKG